MASIKYNKEYNYKVVEAIEMISYITCFIKCHFFYFYYKEKEYCERNVRVKRKRNNLPHFLNVYFYKVLQFQNKIISAFERNLMIY